jgi:hypothetical protein
MNQHVRIKTECKNHVRIKTECKNQNGQTIPCLIIELGGPVYKSNGAKENDKGLIENALTIASKYTKNHQNGIAKVLFKENKIYSLQNNADDWAVIVMKDMKRIRLIGKNTGLSLHRKDRAFHIHDSYDISIDGFYTYYEYPYHFEGEILSKYTSGQDCWIRIKKINGINIPGQGEEYSNRVINEEFILSWQTIAVWEKDRTISQNVIGGSLFPLDAVSVYSAEEQIVDLKLREPTVGSVYDTYNSIVSGEIVSFFVPAITKISRQDPLDQKSLDNWTAGEYFDPMADIGNRVALFFIASSANITLKNIKVHDSFKFVVAAQNNTGPLYFNNFNIVRRPNRYATSVSDGIRVKDGRAPVFIENCTFEGLMDDAINIGATVGILTEIHHGTRRKINIGVHKPFAQMEFNPGDQIDLYNRKTGELVARRTLASSTRWSGIKDGIPSSYKISLTFTQDLPVKKLVPYTHGNDQVTQVFNNANVSRGSVIKNNVFRHKPRHAAIFRANVTFQENDIYDVASGLLIANGVFYREGPLPTNINVHANQIFNIKNTAMTVNMGTIDQIIDTPAKVTGLYFSCSSVHTRKMAPFTLFEDNIINSRGNNNQTIQRDDDYPGPEFIRWPDSPVYAPYCTERFDKIGRYAGYLN